MNVTLNRQKLGLEDLEIGTGIVTQTRGGVEVPVTQINTKDLPYDETSTLGDVVLQVEGYRDDAALSASEASTSEANALASASAASTSEANALASASAASTSEANALASELAAAAILDTFDDRYLGAKSSEPLLDNDGNPLQNGALYFDSTLNVLRVYDLDDVIWRSLPATTLASLTDITLTSIAAGHALTWNGSIWVNTDLSSRTETLTNKSLDSITNFIGANHIHYPIRNESGAEIPKGTVITGSTTQGGTDYIEVVPITDPQTQIALGITHTALADNDTGLAINTGVCIDMVNTSTWVEGTILYPNNSGGLTSVKPTSGRYQACAVVTRSHTNQGTLLVEFSEPKYISSTTQSGYVQLVNDLITDDSTKALTAAQGKILKDLTDTKIGATDVTYENLSSNGDVGTGATQVAQGDHNHSGIYEPADATILKDADIGVTVQAYDATILKDADIGVTVQAYDVDTAKTDVTQTFTLPQRAAVTTDNDLSFDLAATNNFKCTPTATGQLTFTNLADGQGGRIVLDNSGGYVITKNALVLASSTFLDTISVAGKYLIGYECDGTNVFINSTEALV